MFECLCLCVSDCKYVGLTSVPVLYSHLSSGLLWRMLVVYLGVRECTWCMWVYFFFLFFSFLKPVCCHSFTPYFHRSQSAMGGGD